MAINACMQLGLRLFAVVTVIVISIEVEVEVENLVMMVDSCQSHWMFIRPMSHTGLHVIVSCTLCNIVEVVFVVMSLLMIS